ncbi:hypothetical protein BHE74_00030056 [Ensete ventricosum]|nr:hypothetical protein BHE74_00030056 [Ensete ventricosum]
MIHVVSDKFGVCSFDAVYLCVCRVRDVDLTYARSAVQPLTPPYLRQIDFPRQVGHIDRPVVRGRKDVTTRSTSVISRAHLIV